MRPSLPGRHDGPPGNVPAVREAELALLRAEKPALEVLDDPSLNAQTPVERLGGATTPIADFFVRNNGLLPDCPADPQEWRIAIDGLVSAPFELTLRQLKARFETVTLEAVLECAGNGRAFFAETTEGLPWGRGAVGCAAWTGVRLRDVLALAGALPQAVYTAHESPDRRPDGSGRAAISRGLPIGKALAEETLLAFAMNGEPLPFLHGGPLRVVAPGFPGSAWQKWVRRISLIAHEHTGEKMTGLDYRLPRRPLQPGELADPALFEVITDMPVRSLLTAPAEGFVAPAGPLTISGIAWSGHVPVERVEISLDGGATWLAAELETGRDRFAWRRFHRVVDITPGPVSITARASDSNGNRQPLGPARWNPKGYCNNGAHTVEGLAAPAG